MDHGSASRDLSTHRLFVLSIPIKTLIFLASLEVLLITINTLFCRLRLLSYISNKSSRSFSFCNAFRQTLSATSVFMNIIFSPAARPISFIASVAATESEATCWVFNLFCPRRLIAGVVETGVLPPVVGSKSNWRATSCSQLSRTTLVGSVGTASANRCSIS